MIDADRHVSEPLGMWETYLPKSLRVHAPYLVSQRAQNKNGIDEESVSLFLHGQPLFHKLSHSTQNDAMLENKRAGDPNGLAAQPESQIASMDRCAIDIAMLYPSLAQYCVNNKYVAAKLSLAFSDAYNNWLYDYCEYNPHRLRAVALISRHDPKKMINQLEKINANGWRCVVLRPEPIQGRVIGHADYEEFWSACVQYNIGVVFHGGTHLQANTVGSERFNSRFALHACSHPMEAQMAFLSLLESGVLQRHPQLRIAFLEAGASWLPSWLWRLDEICYTSTATEVQNNIQMKPSEYFKRQCWIGFEAQEPCLQVVMDCIGVEQLLFGTDFPHPDHLQFDIDSLFQNHSVFNQQHVDKILTSNPAKFYNL